MLSHLRCPHRRLAAALFFAALLGCLGLGFGLTYFQWSAPLRLGTQNYPPYQVVAPGGAISGFFVDRTRCALDRVGVPYTLEAGPWRDIQRRAERGDLDGLAGTLRTADRDRWAAWSAPISRHVVGLIVVRGRPSPTELDHPVYGTKLASGLAVQMRGIDPNATRREYPDNADILPGLLAGEADFTYMDYDIFAWAAASRGLDVGAFRFTFVQRQDYGMYVASHWLRLHPDFMREFNEALPLCPE